MHGGAQMDLCMPTLRLVAVSVSVMFSVCCSTWTEA
jgi:hypothetical protein